MVDAHYHDYCDADDGAGIHQLLVLWNVSALSFWHTVGHGPRTSHPSTTEGIQTEALSELSLYAALALAQVLAQSFLLQVPFLAETQISQIATRPLKEPHEISPTLFPHPCHQSQTSHHLDHL